MSSMRDGTTRYAGAPIDPRFAALVLDSLGNLEPFLARLAATASPIPKLLEMPATPDLSSG